MEKRDKEEDLKKIKEKLDRIEKDLRLYDLEQKVEELEESIKKIEANMENVDPKAVIKNFFINRGNKEVIKNSLEEILNMVDNLKTDDVHNNESNKHNRYQLKIKPEKKEGQYTKFDEDLYKGISVVLDGLEESDIDIRNPTGQGKVRILGKNKEVEYDVLIPLEKGTMSFFNQKKTEFKNGVLTLYFPKSEL